MDDTQTPATSTRLITTSVPMQNNAATQTDEFEDPPLFSPNLISPDVSSSLPDGYTMRPLRRNDYHGGMLLSRFQTGWTDRSVIQVSSQRSES